MNLFLLPSSQDHFLTRLFTFLGFMAWAMQPLEAQKMESIDSAYLSTLPTFSKNVNRVKEKIWPGMTIGPSCIFRLNGPAFLLNHPQPPLNSTLVSDRIYKLNQADLAIAGTSQTEINAHLTAHNNYGQSFYVSDNQFYAELFHELHHVYQRTQVKKLQFDNPADLLTYPEDYRNDAIRLYENELLLAMVAGPAKQFKDNLNRFFTCRTLRKALIGTKYLNYEKSVESAEGPATYCEYRYMDEFASTLNEQAFINKRFFYSLIEPTYGREGLRNKNLLSGMVQCLLLSRTFKSWQTDYYNSGLALNDYFFSKFTPRLVSLPTLTSYEAKAKYFTSLEKEKHTRHLEAFGNQRGVKVTLLFDSLPEFRGFDPMHAESINDSLTLHSTLLKLGKGKNQFSAINQSTLTLTNKQIWFVKKVVLFVPEQAIKLNKNIFLIKNDTVTLHWHYLNQTKKENEYIITLE